MLADLRESGSIEQDADVVMFIFREEYYLSRAEPTRRPDEADDQVQRPARALARAAARRSYGLAEVIIAKQRHGPIGTIKLHFEAETTKFDNFIGPDTPAGERITRAVEHGHGRPIPPTRAGADPRNRSRRGRRQLAAAGGAGRARRAARRWSRPMATGSGAAPVARGARRRRMPALLRRDARRGHRAARGARRRSRRSPSSTARCPAPTAEFAAAPADPGAQRSRPDRRVASRQSDAAGDAACRYRHGAARPDARASSRRWPTIAPRQRRAGARVISHLACADDARASAERRAARPLRRRAAASPRRARRASPPRPGSFSAATTISIWSGPAPRSMASTRSRAAPTRCARSCG